MNLTDKKEIKKLMEWAAENRKDFLMDNGGKKESFWKVRESKDTNIMPYGFKTIQEFENICESIFEKEVDKEIQRTVSVAAFSSRADYERNRAQRESVLDKMPEYIYVF